MLKATHDGITSVAVVSFSLGVSPLEIYINSQNLGRLNEHSWISWNLKSLM